MSPKEIEAVILEIPEVIDCIIEGSDDDLEGETLKATIILKKGAKRKITKEFIIDHCSQHLSSYKVPQKYDIREDLIFGPTGKKIKKI